MKIMVIGKGGREHALVKAFAENKEVDKVYCIPGNGGTNLIDRCENVNLKTIGGMVDFAVKMGVKIAMPGSEETLVNCIVDKFTDAGIETFGPHGDAAMLEGSKAFAKDFMEKYGIRTADFRQFAVHEDAVEYLDKCKFPVVIKADGLAAGKGVLICGIRKEAEDALKKLMIDRHFGKAGETVVIEEYLKGFEASIHCFYDGKTFLPLLSAKDHKKIGEGEIGPNTGGMGVVVPNPGIDNDLWRDFEENILFPTKIGLESEGLQFQGVIFFGLMIQNGKCYLLEYNMRMGDPETQGLLALLDYDFTSLVVKTLSGNLNGTKLRWKKGSSCCVVLASGGYPGEYRKGYRIEGLSDINNSEVFMAGADLENGGLVTSGGRVLSVVSAGVDLEDARRKCYADVERITFDSMIYRKDIGKFSIPE